MKGDDPDAVEAMLRHLYSLRFTPPTLSLKTDDKVRYYCNVVSVADKYDLPTLAAEAHQGLMTFVTSLEEATSLLEALIILTDEYSEHDSLEQCATMLAAPHMEELASLPAFPLWLTKRRLIVQELIDDAAKFRSNFKTMKSTSVWWCAFCKNLLVVKVQPKCWRNSCGSMGTAYVHDFVPDC